MDFVVLIVVDIRNISPAIKKEITLILEKNLLFKTVYLVDNFENNQVVLSRLLDNENYENVNDYIYNENELLVVTKVIMNLNNEANNRPHDFISKDMINFFSSMSYFKLKLHLTMLLYEIKKGLI